MIEETRKLLESAILDADRQAANRITDEWAATHGYDHAISEILEPTLAKIGLLWDKTGDLSLAQGYVAGKIAEDIMMKAASQGGGLGEREKKGPIVIGNIEEDFHSLGRRLVSIFLRSSGWEVHDLGNDVPPEEFVEEALDVGAKIVAVSAMMYTTAVNIRGVREELEARGLSGKIQIAVGGAVFKLRPELVDEIGADGTTGTAIRTPALMEELWRNAEK